MWEKLVDRRAEPRRDAHPGAQLPAGRDAGGTGAGRDRHRRAHGRAPPRAARGDAASPSCRPCASRLRPRSVDARRPQPPAFRPCRRAAHDRTAERAFPSARVVAQADRVGVRAGQQPAPPGVLRAGRAAPRRAVGTPGGRQTATQEVLPGVSVVRTGGHSGGHQAVVVRGPNGTVGFFGDLCMRPWSANPRWVPRVRRLPADQRGGQGQPLFRQAAEEGWTVVLSHEPRKPVGRLRRSATASSSNRRSDRPLAP